MRGLQSPHSAILEIVSKVEYISELRLQEKYEASLMTPTYPRRLLPLFYVNVVFAPQPLIRVGYNGSYLLNQIS